jgi:hypothetical protein
MRGGRILAVAALLWARTARAGNPEPPETAPKGTEETFLDHSGREPFWWGAEINSILQMKPGFDARYSGPNSLIPESESAVSGLISVYTAYRLFPTTEFIFDAESALGGGISQALGLGGYTNLDVVRNPTLSHEPYLARSEIHQIIPIRGPWEPNEDRDWDNSAPEVPRHRVELHAGKLAVPDFFDINPAGSDSHRQFMNWTVDNNGAYDYAADTRGYTYGFVAEYQGPRLEARFGEFLMPKVANGIDLEWNLSLAHSENFELELKYARRDWWHGALRLLAYINHANMGSYREAIDAFLDGQDTVPDIVAHRKQGRTKYGFGANLYQELGPLFRVCARLGWNDGANESFAYTEVDNTFELCGDMRGTRWRRPFDKVGLAFVTNGISDDHAEYLRLGGSGFLLGDGNLRYGRETIVEQYYDFHIWRGAFVAEDIQRIVNPGYNQDRGPVWVFSLRAHLEF